jgi:hypothetical protein
MNSRAVLRSVEPGNSAVCTVCGRAVKFSARVQNHQVIANVYDGTTWLRVEHYHADCYDEAGQPYGTPKD